ncbi:H-NS histone family protein [Burkholderia pseudomallei]|uniref:H-NS histone family protein n=1 Tax=Burkholderia pseudomallei TaxID=28450 RepID=UPI001AD78AD2|nr:H-NS histone family protein [Burkholderia pseudomallei]MBO7932029.1 H-NS histone family protein [Burkholderia pseudomallei]
MERYLDLMQQLRDLQERVAVARKREVVEAIEVIARTMTTYDITLDEIRNALQRLEEEAAVQASTRRRTIKHIPKYLDPSSGRTWSGRGRTPKWLVGKNLDDFLLSHE